MNDLNCQFYEEFSRLEQLCSEVYQTEDGVANYIGQMASVSTAYAESIPGWIDDLEQLYRFHTLRNALAQSSDALREPLCGEADVQWLRQFRSRVLERRDPMALLKEHGYRADDDAQQRRVDSRCPTVEEEFRKPQDRYVNGPLFVTLLVLAVVLTCLICLFVLTWLS